MSCQCNGQNAIEVIGLCDSSKIDLTTDRTWTELSIPELLSIPCQKPDIESLNKVFVAVKILSKRVIETPVAAGENLEGTKLTGRKLIVEGLLRQKIVYTAAVPTQTVHSAHFDVPFSAFIILDSDAFVDEEFCLDVCVEDVFVMTFNRREIFKNVTLFLRAAPFNIAAGCA